VKNRQEYTLDTNPRRGDSDVDGTRDGDEVYVDAEETPDSEVPPDSEDPPADPDEEETVIDLGGDDDYGYAGCSDPTSNRAWSSAASSSRNATATSSPPRPTSHPRDASRVFRTFGDQTRKMRLVGEVRRRLKVRADALEVDRLDGAGEDVDQVSAVPLVQRRVLGRDSPLHLVAGIRAPEAERVRSRLGGEELAHERGEAAHDDAAEPQDPQDLGGDRDLIARLCGLWLHGKSSGGSGSVIGRAFGEGTRAYDAMPGWLAVSHDQKRSIRSSGRVGLQPAEGVPAPPAVTADQRGGDR
jgi:hypothetical protein